MARFRPQTPALAAVNSERYIIVPCEADGCADLAVIWDRLEERGLVADPGALRRGDAGPEPAAVAAPGAAPGAARGAGITN